MDERQGKTYEDDRPSNGWTHVLHVPFMKKLADGPILPPLSRMWNSVFLTQF